MYKDEGALGDHQAILPCLAFRKLEHQLLVLVSVQQIKPKLNLLAIALFGAHDSPQSHPKVQL